MAMYLNIKIILRYSASEVYSDTPYYDVLLKIDRKDSAKSK